MRGTAGGEGVSDFTDIPTGGTSSLRPGRQGDFLQPSLLNHPGKLLAGGMCGVLNLRIMRHLGL